MGSTIATTSLWGDRLDEYDYTDYGVPLHAPVALDGRWITSIQPHASYGGVSVVTLLYDMLDPERPPPQSITLGKSNELIGCELRVVNPAGGASNMFACGTVLSHLGTTLHIQDTGGAVATAWAASSPETRTLAAVYDLREGFVKGAVDSVVTTPPDFDDNGWNDEPCWRIRVEHAPFTSDWMFTMQNQVTNGLEVTVTLGTNIGTYLVLGVDEPITGSSAHKQLVLQGPVPTWADTGAWYYIDGTRDKMKAAQSGKWRANATGGSSNTTTFTLDEYAAITQEMVGWILQPDVNQQVFAPIIGVNEQTQTVTVSGDLAGPWIITGGNPWLGAKGEHFRIHAPPGTERTEQRAGTLSQWVGAASSRTLYAGYRYESPLAGFKHSLATGGAIVLHRQTGRNFAGQHYTLHRHYDPNLMRFTSPDPIASPFSNLGAYCGNSPGSCYDPDGLTFIVGTDQGFQTKFSETIWGALKWFGSATIELFQGRTDTIDATAEDMTQTMIDRKEANVYSYSERKTFAVTDALGLTSAYELTTGRSSIDRRQLTGEELEQRAAEMTLLVVSTAGGLRGMKAVRFRPPKAKLPSVTKRPHLPVAKLDVPAGVSPKAWGKFGQGMHEKMAAWLQRKHPDTVFEFRVAPGQRGIDATYVSGPDPGFKHAEFKRRTPGSRKTYHKQMKNWNLPHDKTTPYTYDDHGYIYVGWD